MKSEVFIIVATSKDGFISPLNQTDKSSTNWTSPEDTKFFKEKTKQAGVVIYGSKTYLTIPEKYRPLKDRLNVVVTKDPNKFADQFLDNFIASNDSPQEIISILKLKGFDSIAICGGFSIYELFINAGVVDTVYQTIEPISFQEGIPFLSEKSKKLLTPTETIPLSETTKVQVYKVEKK